MQVRLTSFVLTIGLIAWCNAGQAQRAPTIPGCECSVGTEVKYADSNSLGKVYAANCKCGPQTCAVSWNKAIALQCTKGDMLVETGCADFTRLPAGPRASSSERFGGFTVSNRLFGGNKPNLLIAFEDIPQPGGGGATISTPNFLRQGTGGTEFAYMWLHKTAELDVTWFIGAGLTIDIQTGKNQVETKNYPAVAPNTGKATRLTLQHPDGIKKIVLRTPEVEIFQICAFDEMGSTTAAK